jgi:hypothetical protein
MEVGVINGYGLDPLISSGDLKKKNNKNKKQ